MTKGNEEIHTSHFTSKSRNLIGVLSREQELTCELDDKHAINQYRHRQYLIPKDFEAKDFNQQSEVEKIKREFDELVKTWIKETAHFSLERQQISNLSFLKLISMGKKILPLILNELSRRPMQGWFIALQVISRRDDIALNATTIREAVECWLNWGKENGYLKP